MNNKIEFSLDRSVKLLLPDYLYSLWIQGCFRIYRAFLEDRYFLEWDKSNYLYWQPYPQVIYIPFMYRYRWLEVM